MSQIPSMVSTPKTDLGMVLTMLRTERPRMHLIIHIITVIYFTTPADANFKHKIYVIQWADYVVIDKNFKVEFSRWVERSSGNHAPVFL